MCRHGMISSDTFDFEKIDNYDFCDYWRRMKYYNRVKIIGFPYFNLSDVKRIYWVLKGNFDGFEAFAQKAKLIAAPRTEDCYLEPYSFQDEEALFELLKQEFPKRFEISHITCWNELMQYIA